MDPISLQPIDQFLTLFMDAAKTMSVPLQEAGGAIMRALVFVSILPAAAAVTLGAAAPSAAMQQFWGWMLRLFLIGYLGANWPAIVVESMAGAIGLGASAGGFEAEAFLLPSNIVRTAHQFLTPIQQQSEQLCTSLYSCVMNAEILFKLEVAYFLICVAFVFIAFHMISAQVQFVYHGLSSLPLLGTAAFRQTAWISERAIGGLISNMVHILAISLTLGVGMVIFETLEIEADVTVNQATLIAILSIFMAITSWWAARKAQGIVNGGPNLSGNMIASSISSGVSAALGIKAMGQAGAAMMERAGAATNAALYGTGGSSGARATANQQAAFSGARNAGGSTSGAGGGQAAAGLSGSPSGGGGSNPGGATSAGRVASAGGGFEQVRGQMAEAIHGTRMAYREGGIVGLGARGARSTHNAFRKAQARTYDEEE